MSAPSSTTRPAKRRRLHIEDVVRWAIRDELPKKRDDRQISAPSAAPVNPMWRMGVFGSPIDCWHRDPGFPLAMGDPHPDAPVVEAQLEALGERLQLAALGSAACPLDLTPYPIQVELRGKADLDVLIANALHETPKWLATCAIHGSRPEVGEGPVCEPQRSHNGKITLWRTVTKSVTDADGKSWELTHDETTTPARAGEYVSGTFCKLVWTRGALEVLEEQLRYAFWHAALAHLVPELQFLASIEVLPPRAVPTPWLEPEPEPVSPLANLRGERRARLVARICRPSDADIEARRRVGRAKAPRRPSPVRAIDPATWRAPDQRSA